MSEKISVFRSPESQTQYYKAYEAMLGKWPVPYEELLFPNRLVAGLHAEIVPNANHNAQVTAPEVVNGKILEFLMD